MMRQLAVLLGTMGLASGASAAVQTVTVDYVSNLIDIPMFDPSLGTLNSAKLTVDGHLEFPFLDTTRTPGNGPYSYSAFYSFYYLGTFLDVGVTGNGTANFGANPILYLGADGSDSGFIPNDRLAFIQGPGTWDGSIAIDPPYTFTPNDGSIIPDAGGSFSVNGRITVDYDYTAAAVPEPATWGLMISGFALVGGSMRRRGARLRLA